MNAEVMINFILTADELQVKSNFRSVLILCGIAGLVLLVVAIKLFYDRVIGPKIDELEEMDPEERRSRKKNQKSNNTKEDNDNSEEDATEMFQYASITDSESESPLDTDSELNDEEIIEVTAPVCREGKD